MKCKACHSDVPDGVNTCPSCEAAMPTSTHSADAPPGSVCCVHCSGQMQKGKKTERNMALQIAGVFVFLAGLYLLQFIPFGTIGGVVLMLVSLNLGYSRRSGWKCSNCGYFFERA